jgi:hypothetical protein
MKILHIGLCVYDELEGLTLAISKAGEYKQCRPETPYAEIRELYDSFIPDLVFMQIQAENVVDNGLIGYMAQRSIVINWTGDMRKTTPQWMFGAADYNKENIITCFSNERDVKVEIFKSFPYAHGNEIVFMANNYGHFPLSGMRKQAITKLRQRYGTRASIFGNGWQYSNGNYNGNQRAEALFYAGSKIGISISNFNVERYTSDRLLRIMGSGCFCLSHHYNGIERDFNIGEHLDTFRNLDHMCFKIDEYLTNSVDRNRIRVKGYQHIHKNFTYDNMTTHILEIYNKYR